MLNPSVIVPWDLEGSCKLLVLSILGKFKLPKFYMWNEIKICIM